MLLSGGLDAPVSVNNGIVELKDFSLQQNYPNPFNPFTTIGYRIPEMSKVSIKIFNLLGQEIITLVDEIQDAGVKSLGWNATNKHGLPIVSGTYFYRIEAKSLTNPGKSFIETKKMLLIQ